MTEWPTHSSFIPGARSELTRSKRPVTWPESSLVLAFYALAPSPLSYSHILKPNHTQSSCVASHVAGQFSPQSGKWRIASIIDVIDRSPSLAGHSSFLFGGMSSRPLSLRV